MNNLDGRTRRGFLQDALMTATAAGLMGKAALGAETPAQRKDQWLIACRDVHLKETGEANVWAAARAVGVQALEVDVRADGTCPSISSDQEAFTVATGDGARKLRDRLVEEKIRISAFCLHNRFDERPDEEVEEMGRLVRAARIIGTPAIRIDVVPRKLAGKEKEEEFLAFAIDMGRKLIKVSDGSDVRFGVENHGHTTNRPDFLRKLFEGVNSPRFGLTLDTANLYWYGHPLSKLYSIYEEFAPRACHTHCKSINYPESEREKTRPVGWEYGKYCAPVYEGDIDFTRVAAILRKAGYTGDLCIENEALGKFPAEKRRDVLKREAELLRRVAQADKA